MSSHTKDDYDSETDSNTCNREEHDRKTALERPVKQMGYFFVCAEPYL